MLNLHQLIKWSLRLRAELLDKHWLRSERTVTVRINRRDNVKVILPVRGPRISEKIHIANLGIPTFITTARSAMRYYS